MRGRDRAPGRLLWRDVPHGCAMLAVMVYFAFFVGPFRRLDIPLDGNPGRRQAILALLRKYRPDIKP